VSRNAPASNSNAPRALLIGAALIFCVSTIAFAADPFSTASRTGPRARVVAVQDPEATDSFTPINEHVQAMMERGLKAITAKASVREAWLSLISTQDVVGIKVYSAPGGNSGTRPAVAVSLIKTLITAGISPKQIIVWDKSEIDLREAGFFSLEDDLGIRVMASASTGYDPTNFYDTPLIGNLVWGDFEFGKTAEGTGKKSYVSKLVSREITKIINLTPLLNHNTAGVSGNLYGLAAGSVDNFFRFENDLNRMAKAVPEIYAMPSVGDKVVLSIVDALICQYEGGQRGLLHYSAILNQLRFSRDPVALDVLSIKELDRQRRLAKAPYLKPNFDLYINAGLLELGVNDITRITVEIAR
jgi:hypothetical protein